MEEKSKVHELVDNILEKLRGKMADPVAIAEKFFQIAKSYPWDAYDLLRKVE